MSLAIIDLDGTLFNIDHRLHLLELKQYDAFYRACVDDSVNEWCADLILALQLAGHELAFVSGRNDLVKLETAQQIEAIGITLYDLYMRPRNNREPDYQFKSKLFDTTPELYEADILFVLEDRQQVVDMWRSKGLTVLQCAEGGY